MSARSEVHTLRQGLNQVCCRDTDIPQLDGKQASCNAMLPDRKRSHADSLKTWDDMKTFRCLKLPAPLSQSNLGCIPMHLVRARVTKTCLSQDKS